MAERRSAMQASTGMRRAAPAWQDERYFPAPSEDAPVYRFRSTIPTRCMQNLRPPEAFSNGGLRDTSGGTREFGVYDPTATACTFTGHFLNSLPAEQRGIQASLSPTEQHETPRRNLAFLVSPAA